MTTYYNITLASNVPHGSGILDKPCSVVFTYPDGSHSGAYSGTVFAWPTQNTVRMSSVYLNIEAAWVGANGGTLTISTAPPLNFGITAFAKMP